MMATTTQLFLCALAVLVSACAASQVHVQHTLTQHVNFQKPVSQHVLLNGQVQQESVTQHRITKLHTAPTVQVQQVQQESVAQHRITKLYTAPTVQVQQVAQAKELGGTITKHQGGTITKPNRRGCRKIRRVTSRPKGGWSPGVRFWHCHWNCVNLDSPKYIAPQRRCATCRLYCQHGFVMGSDGCPLCQCQTRRPNCLCEAGCGYFLTQMKKKGCFGAKATRRCARGRGRRCSKCQWWATQRAACRAQCTTRKG